MKVPSQSFIMKLLSPLTYPQKFLFISFLFGFSLFVSSYYMFSTQYNAIIFLKQELIGFQYEKLIRKTLEEVSQFYLTSRRYLYGDESAKAQALLIQSQVNADWKNLIALDQVEEKNLLTTEKDFQLRELTSLKPVTIESKWIEFKKIAFDNDPQNLTINAELYDDLLKDINSLIFYIGDVSNINLDYVISTNYMSQIALLNIPELENLLPKIAEKVEKIILTRKKSLTELNELIGLTSNLKKIMQDIQQNMEKAINYEKNLHTNQDLQNNLKEPFRLLKNMVDEFIFYVEKNILSTDELPPNHKEMIELINKTTQLGFIYWDDLVDQFEILIKARLSNYQFSLFVSILITILGAIGGFILGFHIMRSISLPLTQMIETAKTLAAGDLSARVPITNQDEVGQAGQAFNQMAESFQELIGQLQWTGIQLTTSTTEIAATAKQQESTVVEQEATTKEIAATAREISATAKDFAKTMNEVSSTAEQTSLLANAGKAGLTKMEEIMRQMVEAARNIASKLAILNEKAGSITSIITTIAKVADQTNLLSLNAAIEAEKAGEYGRSFTVIAREIRRLADQTANATFDIEKMVNEMVSAVSAGVMGVDKFSEEINTGVKQVSGVSEQLTKIIEQVQQQTSSFEFVNQGMQAQSLSAEQINESINQLSEAAQQTTESIRQFHNAIEQLNNAAQDMQTAVSKIKR